MVPTSGRQALRSFERGNTEESAVLHQDGKHSVRLIRPLYVENSCLTCHETQGYKVGDVRGGISVTVAVDSLWNAEGQQAHSVFAVLGGIWLLGSITIVLIGKAQNQRRWEREQAMAALAHFSAIVNSSQDAIIGETLEGIVTSWNPGAEHLYGYSAEEIVGRSIETLLPPERAGETTTLLARLKDGGRVEHYDTVRRRKNGTLVDVSVTLSSIMDADGKMVGVSTITHDITVRKLRKNRCGRASRGWPVLSTMPRRPFIPRRWTEFSPSSPQSGPSRSATRLRKSKDGASSSSSIRKTWRIARPPSRQLYSRASRNTAPTVSATRTGVGAGTIPPARWSRTSKAAPFLL